MLEKLLENIVSTGIGLTKEEARILAEESSTDSLLAAAEVVTRHFMPVKFDSCSIINAKSGRCPEDCKWCAQSAHYHTGAAEYKLLGSEKMIRAAVMCHERGIGRFSFVTSGRRLNDAEVDAICSCCDEIRSRCSISLCMSSGLLTRPQLERLHSHGVARYHCNLETAPSFFGKLCTTHDQSQKIETLKAALNAGMDICSGGIIGMGESMGQRIELAFKLKELEVGSVPVNVLNPIKGTPLGDQPQLKDDELLRTVAIFRLILPKVYLRFAGGLARFSEETMLKAYRAGINSAIIGDMLTTAGADISSNVELIETAGYEF
ncbi:MAG: biotin synthase BioB [Clostridium sp.]|nr:biotin synthase BioB [Clostridium sp.]